MTFNVELIVELFYMRPPLVCHILRPPSATTVFYHHPLRSSSTTIISTADHHSPLTADCLSPAILLRFSIAEKIAHHHFCNVKLMKPAPLFDV